MKPSIMLAVLKWPTSTSPRTFPSSTTTTSNSSNESSKKSLLECIVFPLGQPLKVTFQGLGGLLKSKLALCLWVFSPIGLMYHFCIPSTHNFEGQIKCENFQLFTHCSNNLKIYFGAVRRYRAVSYTYSRGWSCAGYERRPCR